MQQRGWVSSLWERERHFLLLVTLLGLLGMARAFQPGLLVDNDFVAHFSYVRYLQDQLWPQTGRLIGWCPLYNDGIPFNLFNLPPLTSSLAFGLTFLGIPPAWGLKLMLGMAFLAVPLLTFALTRRTLADGPLASHLEVQPLAPRLACLASLLLTSELWGLDFFFRNGMINAALAVPLVLATVTLALPALQPRGLAQGRFPRLSSLFSLILSGLFLGLTALTHLQSALLAGLWLGCLALPGGRPAGHSGADISWQARLSGLAGRLARASITGLVAFLVAGRWILLSLPFSRQLPEVTWWYRPPGLVLEHFFGGSLFSSYPAAFFHWNLSFSHAGLAATWLGLLGILVLARAASGAAIGHLLFISATFVLSLGPMATPFLSRLPLYDRLLWYRCVTFFMAAWMVPLGVGMARWYAATPLLPTFTQPWLHRGQSAISRLAAWMGLPSGRFFRRGLLLVAGLWVLSVFAQRSQGIETESPQEPHRQVLQQVAEWLAREAAPEARVYAEFLGRVPSAVSINYFRHLLPLESGVPDAMGWVLELSPATAFIQRMGGFDNPAILARFRQSFRIGYILAVSPGAVSALDQQAAFERVLTVEDHVLYRAVDAWPTLARPLSPGVVTGATQQRLLPGGGYRLRFPVTLEDAGTGLRTVEVAVSGVPGWRAQVGGKAAALSVTEEGQLRLVIPPGLRGRQEVVLTWWAETALAGWLKDNGLSSLLFLARGPKPEPRAEAPGQSPAMAVKPSTVDPLEASSHELGLPPPGWRQGIQAGWHPDVLRLEGEADFDSDRPLHLVGGRWGRAVVAEGQVERPLEPGEGPALELRVAAGRQARLWLLGEEGWGGGEGVAVEVSLTETGRVLGTVSGQLGEGLLLPVAPDMGSLEAPGTSLTLSIRGNRVLWIREVRLESGITWLEGESMLNRWLDGGADGRPYAQDQDFWPHNGAALEVAVNPRVAPAWLERRLRITPGRYRLWARLWRQPAARYGHIPWSRLLWEGKPVGSLRGWLGDEELAAKEDTPRARLGWEAVGQLEAGEEGRLGLEVDVRPGQVYGRLLLDLLALEPE